MLRLATASRGCLPLARVAAAATCNNASAVPTHAPRRHKATTPPELVFRSPHADIDIPDVSIDQYVTSGLAALGDKIAFKDVSNGQQITYAELDHHVRERYGLLVFHPHPKHAVH